jgi:hypothetical protein
MGSEEVEEEEEGAEQPSPPGCRVEGQRKRQRGAALAEKDEKYKCSQTKIVVRVRFKSAVCRPSSLPL